MFTECPGLQSNASLPKLPKYRDWCSFAIILIGAQSSVESGLDLRDVLPVFVISLP